MHDGLHAENRRALAVAAATPESVARLGDVALYRWAATWLAGMDVLQICDAGGPAAAVVDAASSVTCVVARQALADAVEDEFRGAVGVRCGDPTRLPFPPEAFGAVLCPAAATAADPASVLAELTRVLRPHEGILVLTPDVVASTPAEAGEEGPQLDALRKQFGHVAVLEQRDSFVSLFEVVSPVDADDPARDPVREAPTTVELGAGAGTGRRTVLVASDSPLPDFGPMAAVAPMDVAAWQHARVEQLAAAATLGARPAPPTLEQDYLLRQLFLSEQTLALALDRTNRREAALSDELAETHRRLLAALHDLNRARAETHEQVVALKSSTSWRATEPLRQLKRIAGYGERS